MPRHTPSWLEYYSEPDNLADLFWRVADVLLPELGLQIISKDQETLNAAIARWAEHLQSQGEPAVPGGQVFVYGAYCSLTWHILNSGLEIPVRDSGALEHHLRVRANGYARLRHAGLRSPIGYVALLFGARLCDVAYTSLVQHEPLDPTLAVLNPAALSGLVFRVADGETEEASVFTMVQTLASIPEASWAEAS